MFGKLFGRGGDGPGADPYALPTPRRKNGTYALRALGDTRVLAVEEAAATGDWDAVKAALTAFDLGHDHQVRVHVHVYEHATLRVRPRREF
ncbi:hypothetical protein ACWDRX_00880, partial [Streptomyces nigra]